jgi:hypothetical protein
VLSFLVWRHETFPGLAACPGFRGICAPAPLAGLGNANQPRGKTRELQVRGQTQLIKATEGNPPKRIVRRSPRCGEADRVACVNRVRDLPVLDPRHASSSWRGTRTALRDTFPEETSGKLTTSFVLKLRFRTNASPVSPIQCVLFPCFFLLSLRSLHHVSSLVCCQEDGWGLVPD